jgi:IstB-like ATP binding protein
MLTGLADLAALGSDSALRRRLRHYAGPRLLVIDEVGYLSYSNRHADLLFELVSRRYEHNSTIVTTNRPFAKWREVFPNAACGRLPRPLSSPAQASPSMRRFTVSVMAAPPAISAADPG